jgi:hypothetical protein
LPAFSIAVLISSRGLPILDIPFSINLATGDFEWAYFALSIRPFLMFSYLSHEVNVDFDAALIAIKRSV